MRLTLQLLISHGRVARKMGLGPESRINMLRNILTGLVRHERIETTVARADEVRFYAEKVTSIFGIGELANIGLVLCVFTIKVIGGKFVLKHKRLQSFLNDVLITLSNLVQ